MGKRGKRARRGPAAVGPALAGPHKGHSPGPAKARPHKANTVGAGFSRPEQRSGSNRTVFALLLALAAIWAYSTSFGGVLVLDDIRAVERNTTIRTLWSLSTPLSPPPESTVAGRPVANLTFAIDHALAPGSVRRYHLTNLLIHVLAGLALFGVMRRALLSGRLRERFAAPADWLAFAVAAIWLVHPLQTESVTYVVQRVESLAGLFYLLTVYASIRALEASRRRVRGWMAVAIATCALGMATKEVMATVPIMVGLWAWTFAPGADTRRRQTLLGGLAATWIILGALVFLEHRAPSIDLAGATVWQYLLTQAEVVTHYLRLAIVGSPLVFLYTWPLATSLVAVLPQAILLTVLVALTIAGLARRHPLGFVGAWFFLILAPTSTILPIVTEVAAEHRMYLPLAAVIALVAAAVTLGGRVALARLVPGLRARRRAGATAGAALVVLAVAGYGTMTRARNLDYSSAVRLWGDTVAKEPGNQRARVAYGEALANAGRLPEAEAEYRAAVDLAPADATALARLGGVLAAQGRLDEAVPFFERALATRPGDVDAHRGLGLALAAQREDARAIGHLERALAAQPDDAVVAGQLATILADSRDESLRNGARAVALAEQAVRLTTRRDPTSLEILSVALAAVERYADAAAAATEALALARARGDRALASRLEYRANTYRAMADARGPR